MKIDAQQFRRLSPADQLSQLRGSRAEREFRIERAAIDEERRTAWLSIASAAPYLRWWGQETLAINTKAINAERLKAKAPLLVNHDTKDHVGVIEGYEIKGGKLRVLARFGRNERAQDVFNDVLDGILVSTSVAYTVDDLVLERTVDGVPHFLVTNWTPYEGSLVSVPADFTVGVGRSHIERQVMEEHPTEPLPRGIRRLAARQQVATQLQSVPSADLKAFRSHLEALGDEDGDALSIGTVLRHVNVEEEYERWRSDWIRSYGARYSRYGGDELAAQAIANRGMTADAFRQALLEKVEQGQSNRLNTGELEMDNPGFGQAARVSERYGNLQAFKGADAEKRAYACGMFFRSIAGDTRAASWCKENGIVASRVMTEGVFSAGGAAVPSIVEAAIISNVEMYGTFRRFARVWPMTSASLAVPTNGEGLTVAAVGETTATTTSDLSIGQVTLSAKEFAGGARASRSLLEDNVVALGDFLISEFSRALAKIEDQCGWIGDGTSTYGGMQGIAYRIKNDANVAGAKVVAVNAAHDTFSEIDITDLVRVMSAVPEYARQGAAWYCSGTAKDVVFSQIVATAGGNNTQTLSGGVGENFLGYPIRTSPVLPAGVATDYSGEVMMLFGNLAMASAFGDRRALMAEIDTSRYVEYRQTYFQVSERFDIVNHLNGTSATVCGPMAALMGGAS